MSQALQRVIVRMLHDPALVAAVAAGAPLPELSDRERALLDAVDPRAFGIDAFRRSRLLRACIEELPVATALLTGGGRELSGADAFLSSAAFHESVQSRGVVVLAYAGWLRARVGPLVEIEAAVAQARRRRRPAGGAYALAAGAWPFAIPVGGLERWAAVRGRLGPAPLERLVGEGIELKGLPLLGRGEEHYLARVGADGEAALEGSSEGLHAILLAAIPGGDRAMLEAVAVGEGASPQDALEIIEELVRDGWLVGPLL